MLFTVGIPIGLSFYALQQVMVIIDCRHKAMTILPYTRHLLYLGFFPNFIAGPIFQYRKAVEPISTLGYKPIPDDWVGNGLLLFLVGLSKKLWIANPIGGAIDHIITKIQTPDTGLNIFEAWFVVWGFLVQLYFDFSAYSDIAIGLAMCFGILLPINFDSPLKAYSTQEYISRWHMSFTGFVREYFFIPILGLLKKLPIKNTENKMTIAWAVGLFSSYIIIGAWHAPNLVVMTSSTVLILILFIIKLPSLLSKQTKKTASNNKIRKHINRCVLLLVAMLTAICFKTQDIDILQKIYISLVSFDNISLPPFMQQILPSFIEKAMSFTGISPLLNDYQTGEHIFTQTKVFFVTLLIATLIIFLSPNTMTIFGIKNTDNSHSFKLGQGLIFHFLFIFLFFTTIFVLVFETHQIQNFIYEKF
tara:strand:+ start:60 stop:1313 length:1254 start_codon:yes stop_codon:yes gene_type:complete